ncbi:hypothetical protein SAMN04515617_114152 [Collimonas sp. OK242]|uniref:hypothetical protein n=1 Tax=Collimonas sp. OK242 TaxID=1798195 RepID=UPI000895B931|nr:hypothetical protein [Collimonas sp. OK242]SDY45458.1 hypothetical protein SAMN04515617_114152 [Collimonas sp. OK242]
MTKDSGSWLSAEQAVLPDGTERKNLPLIKKKLPTLSPSPTNDVISSTNSAHIQAEQAASGADE